MPGVSRSASLLATGEWREKALQAECEGRSSRRCAVTRNEWSASGVWRKDLGVTVTLHQEEVPVDEGIVRSLLKEQCPHWAGLSVARAGAGTDNVT
jgi:hypothetical protein